MGIHHWARRQRAACSAKRLTGTVLLGSLALGLAGCLDDWLGFPGPDMAYGEDRAPERAAMLLSSAAQDLKARAYDLPQAPVDFSLRLRPRPSGNSLHRAAMRDALGGATLRERALWVTRLRNAEPLPRVAYALDADPESGRLLPWADAVAPAHVLTDPTLALAAVTGADTADTADAESRLIWLEPSAADLADYQTVIDALANSSAIVLLVDCAGHQSGAAPDSRMQACLLWAGESPRVRILLDTVASVSASRSALVRLLQHPQLFGQIRYASHWPLPAQNMQIRLAALADDGLIPADSVPLLRELYSVNPLAFDLATKRLLRLPGTTIGLPDVAFGAVEQPDNPEESES